MTIPQAAKAALDHRLATAQSKFRQPSVVAGLLRDGELLWTGGAGLVDGAAPTNNTQYRIGSITKTFIAAAVMQLVEHGHVRLVDDVLDHLGDDWTGHRALDSVRIGDLLTHSGGLGSETLGPWWERVAGGDAAELTGLVTESGTRGVFHYSNTGFGILGDLLAEHHRRPWHDVVADAFLGPLHMTRTTLRPEAPAAPGTAVHPYADLTLDEPEFDGGAMAPAGQFWSTIEDMARWARFLSGRGGDDLLTTHTRALMHRPGPVADIRGANWSSAMGLGVQVFNTDGTTSVGHGGSMPGFLAILRIEPDSGTGVVMATNTTAGADRTLADDLVKLLEQHAPPTPSVWTPTPSSAATKEILGVWYWGASAVSISASGDDLTLKPLVAGRSSRFAPDGEDTWVGLDAYYQGEPLRIVRADDGTVTHLDLTSFIFTRQPYDPPHVHPGGRNDDWS